MSQQTATSQSAVAPCDGFADQRITLPRATITRKGGCRQQRQLVCPKMKLANLRRSEDEDLPVVRRTLYDGLGSPSYVKKLSTARLTSRSRNLGGFRESGKSSPWHR